MAPSRSQDDFVLELRLNPPEQREEDVLRHYIQWLRNSIEIVDSAGSIKDTSQIKNFTNAIRSAAYRVTSPPSSPPDFMYDSPPFHFTIHPRVACEYMGSAFRVWVTELRPRFRADFLDQGQICSEALDKKKEGTADCVLLAELDVPLTTDHGAIGGTVEVNEDRRPILLNTRMLQEQVLCGGGMWK
jgi:hypothetical protein